ncbi:MAG: penicillin-binding transpeptidase domain-containing protein [Planctomycetota bacterium]|nr:penicillin-binding transpeptidase domain-containing protein [Planctomycetota bacterium]
MALLFLPAVFILVRMFDLQVIHGADFKEAQERTSERVEALPALRGRILDRNGNILAFDEMVFDLNIILAEIEEPESLFMSITELTGIENEKLNERFLSIVQLVNDRAGFAVINEGGVRKTVKRGEREKRRVLRSEMRVPYELVRGLSFEEMSWFVTRADQFPGVVFTERTKRKYPQGEAACHVIGYIGPLYRADSHGAIEYERLERADFFRNRFSEEVSDDHYDTLEARGTFKADVLGRTGVEKTFDTLLAGLRGFRIVERDLRTRREREIRKAAPRPGCDVRLTIDLPLQRHVESVLASARKPAVAVVMDVRTGEVLALVSAPGYSPDRLQSPVSPDTVREIVQDKARRPLINRAISEQYMLGSIFKVVTAVAGLEEGRITPTTEFECTGRFRENVPGFKCWIGAADIGGSHGSIPLEKGMAVSCNVYFIETGDRVKGGPLSQWAGRFGYGEPTGIELPGEVTGTLPRPDRPVVGAAWSDIDTWNLCIGQGALAVTPLQVAQMMATIGRGTDEGGQVRLVRPHIVLETRDSTGLTQDAQGQGPRNDGSGIEGWRLLPIEDGTIRAVRAALRAVVNDAEGTAHKSALAQLDSVCGKTSTAELSKTGTPAPHAWFAGFMPAEQPRFSFVVLVENGGKGSEVAAPLCAKIVEYLIRMR